METNENVLSPAWCSRLRIMTGVQYSPEFHRPRSGKCRSCGINNNNNKIAAPRRRRATDVKFKRQEGDVICK
ncbi:hypothetical protein TNCV_1217341 [Trichonephila clavipes]|nr:hypothetical protein TNCV_1217341 [Trichonephila clavipes]